MANTYSQSYFHLVFAVKHRKALINKVWHEKLEKYITGIIQTQGHKLLAIYARPDHIHIFIGYNLSQTIPDLVEHIKTSSNAWIKENQLSPYKFDWQKGYGAFTCSHSQISNVIKYILNQEEHHRKSTFKEEYIKMLEHNEVQFNLNYVFDFLDKE